MLLTIITISSFCAGVFVGALIVSSKDRPLKKPLVEDWETHYYKDAKKKTV